MGASASVRNLGRSKKKYTTAEPPMLPTDCQAEGIKTFATTAVPSEKSPREKRSPSHQSAVSSATTAVPSEQPPLDSIVGGLKRQVSDCDLPHAGWSRQDSQTTAYYGAPEQTLIFLDWDDTLFPTTDLLRRMDLEQYMVSKDPLPADVVELLAGWRAAVYTYLVTATKLSARCVIVTNARRPWIDNCCKVFAPELMPMIDEKTGTVGVVYANEVPLGKRRTRIKDCLIPTAKTVEDEAFATQEKLTKQKQAAMHRETSRFYSQYPGQTWKNIFSIGDMHYEHDALQEVTFTRKAPHEREQIRTKAILVPSQPALAELTLRLRFGATVLPAYIKFDGDIDVDLKTTQEPYKMVMKALGLPSLAELDFPLFAWGRGPTPSNEEIQDALRSLEDRLTDAMS